MIVLLGLDPQPGLVLDLGRHLVEAFLGFGFAFAVTIAGGGDAGLAGDRYHALQQKYCPKGGGAVFTFGVKGGYDAGVKVVSSTKLFSHLANIGDTRSLIIHPASTTHRQLSDQQKTSAGAGPDVIRLSVGIEDKEDIIADLDQALASA